MEALYSDVATVFFRGLLAIVFGLIIAQACLYPPHVTISRWIQRMKGKSSYRLLAEYPPMRKRFWGRDVWGRGYFCRNSGNVTDEVIKAYIAPQSHDSDDVFRIEGEVSPPGDTPIGDPSGEGPSPRLEPAGAGRDAA